MNTTSTTGRQLLDFVNEVCGFNKKLGDLLKNVEEMMKNEGWQSAIGSFCYNSSSSIVGSHVWFPDTMFRFYNSDKYPHLITFFSILLYNKDNNEFDVFEEPLVTAGFFDYGLPNALELWKRQYWHSRFHGYMPNRKDNGEWNDVNNPNETWSKDEVKYIFERVSTIGLPLADITNSKILNLKIISPLIKQIKDEYNMNT